MKKIWDFNIVMSGQFCTLAMFFSDGVDAGDDGDGDVSAAEFEAGDDGDGDSDEFDTGAFGADLQVGEKPEPVSQLSNRADNLSSRSLKIICFGDNFIMIIIQRQLFMDNLSMTIIQRQLFTMIII